jgi:hypothetical protein
LPLWRAGFYILIPCCKGCPVDLEINDPEAERLAVELAAALGVSVEGAVKMALRSRLRRLQAEQAAKGTALPEKNP